MSLQSYQDLVSSAYEDWKRENPLIIGNAVVHAIFESGFVRGYGSAQAVQISFNRAGKRAEDRAKKSKS